MEVSVSDASAIIEMAWSDFVPFEAIEHQFGLSEPDVIALMKKQLKPGSFRVWRERVRGRENKHARLKLGGNTGGKTHVPD